MKKFHYSLETLLQVRGEAENIAHRNLLKAQIHLQNMFKILETIEKEYFAFSEYINRIQQHRFYAEDISVYFEYLIKLESKINAQVEEVLKAQNRVEDMRQIVIKAMTQKKILEKLKEQQYKIWKTEGAIQDTIFFDEISTSRYIREHKKERDV